MCGVNYKPSERKRRLRLLRRMSHLPRGKKLLRKMTAIWNEQNDSHTESEYYRNRHGSISKNMYKTSTCTTLSENENEINDEMKSNTEDNAERETTDTDMENEKKYKRTRFEMIQEQLENVSEHEDEDAFFEDATERKSFANNAFDCTENLDADLSDSYMRLPEPSNVSSSKDLVQENILASNLNLDKGLPEPNIEEFMCNPKKYEESPTINTPEFSNFFPKTNRIASIANRTTFDALSTPPVQRQTPCNCMVKKRHSVDTSSLMDKYGEIMENFRKRDFLDCSTIAYRPKRLSKLASLDVYIDSSNLSGNIRSLLASDIGLVGQETTVKQELGIEYNRNRFLSTSQTGDDRSFVGYRLNRSHSAQLPSTNEYSRRHESCSHCDLTSRRQSTTTQSSNSEYPSRLNSLDQEAAKQYHERRAGRKFSIC